ncbi:hypothetical protein [Botrimarina mediterranea]|uniref:hypothetical protein n=1 Tax=Botrimarina mediterranea TaxID=2528022 RepID=UPI0011A2E462
MSTFSEIPELSGVSIVVIGRFNPLIFSPRWLRDNDLISVEAADGADIEIIHQDICDFVVEQVHVQVTENRLSIGSAHPAARSVARDLAVGALSVLEHTPIRVFGLNTDQHFRMPSVDEWHAVGHHFAPKDDWGDILEDPGTRVVEMLGRLPGTSAYSVNVRLEPSRQIRPGVYFRINQHYSLQDDEEVDASADGYDFTVNRLVECITKDWDEFLAFSSRVPLHLLKAALK